jgi:hypothetical protein
MAPTVHLPMEIMILDHQFMILKKFRYDLLLQRYITFDSTHFPLTININYKSKGELFYNVLFKCFVYFYSTSEQHVDLREGWKCQIGTGKLLKQGWCTSELKYVT